MKISFIVPPVIDGNKQPAERTAGCTRVVYLAPNIYELTAVAVLEQENRYDISYHDMVYDNAGVDQLDDFLAADDSDVYCLWTVNLSIENDLMVISHIREHRPKAFVVLMGPGPTHFIEKCLADERVIIVRGEPEMTLRELAAALEKGEGWQQVQGTSCLVDGKVRNNGFRPLMKSLDDLPMPARHFIADHRYYNPKLKTGPYTTMVTSRNCPYRCIYCVPSSLTFAREIENRRETGHKPFISYRSPERVEEEVKMLHEQGFKAIGVMDDNFIWKNNEERTHALCDIFKKYDMLWGCQARVDAITENVARWLGESGCRYVDLGVESFNDDILKYIHKDITVADIHHAVELLKKYNVPVKLNILIGCSPLETRETVKHTLREAKKLDVDQVMFNIVSPFPATEYYEQCITNHWIDKYVPTDVQRESILNLPHLSSKEMERMLFWNNIQYFLTPRFVIKQLRRFTSWSEFTHALSALKIKLFG